MGLLWRPSIDLVGWAGHRTLLPLEKKLLLSLQADLIPNITQGKWAIHLSPAARALRASLSRR
jgi:hypothetical protein